MAQPNKIFFRSFLSHPWKQAKYAFVIAICFALVNTLTLVFLHTKLQEYKWEHALDWQTLSKVMLVLSDSMMDAALYGLLLGFILSFGVMIYITHRFVGPYISIKRFISAHLRNENPPDLRVRKGDEIHDVVELINLLAKKKR